MKKRIFIISIVLFTFFATNVSATDVSGDAWGEWTSAGNPYNVVGDLRVPAGSTLVIRPGCYVGFQGYYHLLVDNSALLQAQGAESDSIIFTALDTIAGWNGIIFDHSDSNSSLDYCRFEYVIGDSIGMVVNITYSNLHIKHSTFTRNRVITVIECGSHAGVVIEDNIFTSNIVEDVIAHFGALPTYISGNIFEHNDGVCVVMQFGGESMVRNNIFRHNIGLVMYSRWSLTEFSRNVVYNNFSDEFPSVFFGMDADYTIENNTVCNNTSTSVFYPIAYFETEHVPQPAYMINNIFWGNVYEGNSIFRTSQSYLTVIYCDVQGGWPDANIDADPLFVDTANGDYHLLAGSPCIDAGSPFSPLDPDSTRTDMGALYFDQTVGMETPPIIPREITLYQNYPNPFNAGTIIRFELPYDCRVSIDVYDILGRKVSSIIDAYYLPGAHEVGWNGVSRNGKELPSGIYLYKLKGDTFEQTRKMMLLK